jgi:predicted kinase
VSRPLLVVVTGAPASGKTTIARDLAAELGLPLVVKDDIKERLYEAFGSGDELEAKIDRAAAAILFTTVDSQLAAGVSVLAESNFEARSDPAPFRALCAKHDFALVQIHCSRDPDAVEQEFAERVEEGRRHPGHRDEPGDAADVRADMESGRWDPLDIPGELIEIDADDFDLGALIARLRN